MMYGEWVRERGTDCYCPIDADGYIVTGMNLIGLPPNGRVLGEFWFTEDGDVVAEPYETAIEIADDDGE